MNSRHAWWVAACCVAISGCGQDSTVTSTASALEVAQCDYGSFENQAAGCRATYDTCAAADGADVTACREALRACLPPPPDRGGHRPGDGGSCRGQEGNDGSGHGRHGGGRPDGGRPGEGPHQGHGPHPDPAAIQACRDALATCQSADAADTTCQDTERACVKAAFDAAFEAACAEATARCAGDPSEACVRVLTRCSEGVSGTCVSAVVP